MTKIQWYQVAVNHGFTLSFEDFEVMITATGLGYSMEAINVITKE